MTCMFDSKLPPTFPNDAFSSKQNIQSKLYWMRKGWLTVFLPVIRILVS